jgi:amidophosphoribosyltransferase
MADRSELVAAGRSVEEIAELVGSASLAYLSLDGLQRALGRPAGDYCRACFTGEYPIPVPDSSLKLRFEPGAREPARV